MLWAVLVLAVVGALSLRWVSQPTQFSGLLLHSLGRALNLEITASGSSEYRLRGTPMLVVRDVVAREPGAAQPLLRARRVYLSLPWSTLRARGAQLTARRIELDAPQIDLPALQHWLASRPPAETRLPTLVEGLRVRDGVIVGDGWRMDGVFVELPTLAPEQPLRARLRGTYVDRPLRVAINLAIALSQPQRLIENRATGFAANGTLALDHGDWRLPMTLALSGPLRTGNGLQLLPARLGLAARYEAGDTRLPFAFGAFGPLHFGDGALTLNNAGFALRPRGPADATPVPALDAHGALGFGQALSIDLQGVIAGWPAAWPALPPPLSASRSPLPFALRYSGPTDLSAVADLQLRRDDTHFEGRFRLPQVLDWTNAVAAGSLLPPIDGRLSTPTLEISGAVLEGVQIEFDDPASGSPAAPSAPSATP